LSRTTDRILEHADARQQTRLDLAALFDTLENEVVPLFYDQDDTGVPRAWVARQKNAIRTLAWRFSARRMLKDYVMGSYLPATGGLTASLAPTASAAHYSVLFYDGKKGLAANR